MGPRFTRRLFGFNHLIEVYKQAHQRVYGYYVLPLLIGDPPWGAPISSHIVTKDFCG